MLSQLPANRFIRHLLFWVGVVLFFFIGFYTQPEVYKGDPIPFNPVFFLAELFFSSLISFLFYVYLLVYILLPLAYRQSYGWFAVGLLGLNIMTSLVYEVLDYEKSLLLQWIGYDSSQFVDTIEFANPFIQPIFFESNLVAGLMVGIKLFSRWYQKQQESQQLEREKIQTELQLLKLQLSPDFLFNSLDQLATMTVQKSQYAPELVLKLAHLLRYVLYESQAELVPLAREVDVIEHYLFLQRIIHPTRLEVSFTVRGCTEYPSIAPLSLFPIVENAFNQLPATRADEPVWVSVDLAASDTTLTLKVINAQSDISTDNVNQLADIRKQLAFYYPDNHSLKIWQEDQLTVVTLIISFPTDGLEIKPLWTHPIDSIA